MSALPGASGRGAGRNLSANTSPHPMQNARQRFAFPCVAALGLGLFLIALRASAADPVKAEVTGPIKSIAELQRIDPHHPGEVTVLSLDVEAKKVCDTPGN